MNFIRYTPTLIVTPVVEQETAVNMTPLIQQYYNTKRHQRINDLVLITNLTIPLGVVIGYDTHIIPELIVQSSDEQAAIEFCRAFFKKEETDLFKVVNNTEQRRSNDVQDMQ